jgi:hypothetical protein
MKKEFLEKFLGGCEGAMFNGKRALNPNLELKTLKNLNIITN